MNDVATYQVVQKEQHAKAQRVSRLDVLKAQHASMRVANSHQQPSYHPKEQQTHYQQEPSFQNRREQQMRFLKEPSYRRQKEQQKHFPQEPNYQTPAPQKHFQLEPSCLKQLVLKPVLTIRRPAMQLLTIRRTERSSALAVQSVVLELVRRDRGCRRT